jgi:hypothetical protein
VPAASIAARLRPPGLPDDLRLAKTSINCPLNTEWLGKRNGLPRELRT